MIRLENFASSVVRCSFQNEVPLTKNEVKPCLMEYRFIQKNCITFTSNSVGFSNVGYERPTTFHNGYHAMFAHRVPLPYVCQIYSKKEIQSE